MMEVFIPKKRIPVKTHEEAEEYRILYSGKKNIYQSVYEYNNEINPRNAIVDKIFLDFDYDDDLVFFDNVRKVAKYLADSEYTFSIRFSGRGFHIFIYLDPNIKLKNPKRAIRNWVKDMHTKTNTQSDSSVVGDLRRVSRMLNSMNLKTHLYCIAIQYNELMNFTYESICEIAKDINDKSTDKYYLGKKYLDLSDFDVADEPKSLNYKINKNNIQVQNGFPPCILEMLKNPELGYYERGQLILYLRDDGYSFYEILTILKNVLSEKKYYHCTQEEGQVEYLYFVRENMLFSSCQTLKSNGLCPSDICQGQCLYL